MKVITFPIAIIGLIISIRSKERISKIGTIFFTLYIVQFAYSITKLLIIHKLYVTHVISGEDFAKYTAITNVPEMLFDIAAIVTIIIGVLKETSIRNQKGKVYE